MRSLTDKQLHALAKKRVEFRTHLIVYFVIISALWVIWYVTGGHYPWPIWPMAGWGIGVFFHYMFDYRSFRLFSEQEEYKKLKREWGNKNSGLNRFQKI